MKKNFFDIFPTPKFLDIPAAGLSFNNDYISLVEFTIKKRKTFLEKYHLQDIPSGLVHAGEIKEMGEIVKIFSEIKEKHDLDFVRVSLPEEKAFLFRATLPAMSSGEIRDALHFKIEENVPIPSDEAVFDFYPVYNNKKNIEVIVTVLPKDIIGHYLEVFEKSGLRPLSFKVESQAISHSVVKDSDKSASLIINVAKSKIGLYLMSGGLVQFSSTTDFGSDFFDSLSLSDDKNKKQADQFEKGMRIYKPQISKEAVFKEEIEKLMNYWTSIRSKKNIAGGDIKKIIACGERVLDKNFKDFFSFFFSVPLEPANVWTNVFSLDEYIPDITFEESLKYPAAVGVAIPQNSKESKI